MKFFYGTRQKGPYFEGWYLKHQSRDGQSLALIPAFHIDGRGRRSASLQVITDSSSWWLEYPDTQFRAAENRFLVQLGPSRFGCRGIWLCIQREDLLLRGILDYGPFTPLRRDIMGPFRLFSGMQCSHSVLSMGHPLEGTLELNGKILDFSGGLGYIEGDRGRSFPSAYLWTQCLWGPPSSGSLMLAIAAVPTPVGSFTGCICSVLYHGREYRLATYRGAKIVTWSSTGAVLRQGRYRLAAELLGGRGQVLRAPVEGSMRRTVRESLRADVRYRFWEGERLIFEHTGCRASFEYSESGPGAGRPGEGAKKGG